MRLAVLNELWQQVNAGGEIERHDTRGDVFRVTYREGGKVYKFTAASIPALGERLELIPEVNVPRESERIVADLAQGVQASGPAVCFDTVRFLWGLRGGQVDYSLTGQDKFDNDMADFSISFKPDAWA